MFAGYGNKVPYGWGNTTQVGFLALIDQTGVPYWIYKTKENLFFGNTNCTYIQQVTQNSVDYVYAICNMPRWDLSYTGAMYLTSPVIIKL